LRLIYLKSLAASALVAMILALRVRLEWGGAFAAGALIGTLNWFLLALMLLALVRKSAGKALMFLGAKLTLLAVMMVLVLPAVVSSLWPFLLGFHMFLLMALLEAGGSLYSDWLRKTADRAGRPLPQSLSVLFTGKAKDA